MGAKVLEQISAYLQKELSGLKGFSSGNLKKIRIFAEAYSPHLTIGSALSSQTENNDFYEAFAGISFSHHFTILVKIKDWRQL